MERVWYIWATVEGQRVGHGGAGQERKLEKWAEGGLRGQVSMERRVDFILRVTEDLSRV